MTAGLDIVAAARTKVVRRLPYFADPTMSLRPFELPGFGTFGVDAESRLAVDPEVAIVWGPVRTATAVFHEALHMVLNHHGRRGWREPVRWNYAADCEANRIVLEAGFEFPPEFKPVTAESLGFPPNLSAEEYYDLLPADFVGPSQPFPGCGQMDGEGAGAPQGWEAKADELSGGIVGQKPGEQRAMRRALASKVQAAAKTKRKGIGSVPAGLEVWAALELTPPTIPWQNVLASLLRSAVASRSGADDYTRMRVSRRSTSMLASGGPILPALRAPKPEIGIVVDLSGSMSGKPAMTALSETWGVVRALGLPIRAYAVDAALHAVVNVQSLVDLEKLNKGGGGTDMRIGIKAADRDRQDVILVLTDGLTPWPLPSEMPHAALVIGVIGDAQTPDYLRRVVRIPVEE
jgi:predicted metal-dependent peptidase